MGAGHRGGGNRPPGIRGLPADRRPDRRRPRGRDGAPGRKQRRAIWRRSGRRRGTGRSGRPLRGRRSFRDGGFPGTAVFPGTARFPGTAVFPGTARFPGTAVFPGTARFSGTAVFPGMARSPGTALRSRHLASPRMVHCSRRTAAGPGQTAGPESRTPGRRSPSSTWHPRWSRVRWPDCGSPSCMAGWPPRRRTA